MTEIVQNVILSNLIENVVPTNLSKDPKSALYAIWQSQMSYLRISLENQKNHHFDSTKFSIVGNPLNNTLKILIFEHKFGIPKIFSNVTFINWILSQERDEILKNKLLDLDFHFRPEFPRKKNYFESPSSLLISNSVIYLYSKIPLTLFEISKENGDLGKSKIILIFFSWKFGSKVEI